MRNYSRGRPGRDPNPDALPSPGHQADGATHAIQNYVGVLASTPCHFKLERYPFDKQLCNISYMLMNAPWTRVFHKSKPGANVDYFDSVGRREDGREAGLCSLQIFDSKDLL